MCDSNDDPLVPPPIATQVAVPLPTWVDSLTAGYTEVVVAELSRIVARRVAPWETPATRQSLLRE